MFWHEFNFFPFCQIFGNFIYYLCQNFIIIIKLRICKFLTVGFEMPTLKLKNLRHNKNMFNNFL